MVPNVARGLVQVSEDVSDAVWTAITTGAWPYGGSSLLPSVQ